MGRTVKESDIPDLKARGVAPEEVERQAAILINPPAKLHVDRPCTIGDGIVKIGPAEAAALVKRAEEAILDGRLIDFVPASGAASRMFADLAAGLENAAALDDEKKLRELAQNGSKDERKWAQGVITFFENLPRFACFADLKECALRMSGGAIDLERMQPSDFFSQGRAKLVLDALLNQPGLNYANKPKALLAFHRYGDEMLTAAEEHLENALLTGADRRGEYRLHFTRSPEDKGGFDELLKKALPGVEQRGGFKFKVTFSVQHPATDTVALGSDKTVYRRPDGKLFFRAGGHGALIRNMNELGGDIVYLNNIDNVQPRGRKEEFARSKKVLMGKLIEVQERVFEALRAIGAGRADPEALRRGLLKEINIVIPDEKWNGLSGAEKTGLVQGLLNRPIRMAGVVKNEGEPGGGPLWVKGSDGMCTPQIVEEAEVDAKNPEQMHGYRSGTHFNPVRVMCGLRDYQGRQFDLERFVNPRAVFLSDKTVGADKIRALERPGLWNGAMADWITVFVEVDIRSFTPTKTFADWLRPQHQPE